MEPATDQTVPEKPLSSKLFNVIVGLIILDVIFVILGGLLFNRTKRYVRKKGALSQF